MPRLDLDVEAACLRLASFGQHAKLLRVVSPQAQDLIEARYVGKGRAEKEDRPEEPGEGIASRRIRAVGSGSLETQFPTGVPTEPRSRPVSSSFRNATSEPTFGVECRQDDSRHGRLHRRTPCLAH